MYCNKVCFAIPLSISVTYGITFRLCVSSLKVLIMSNSSEANYVSATSGSCGAGGFQQQG